MMDVADFFPDARLVAGVDEVGRGPLAGDVVAAAVILDERELIEGLMDSKKLSAKKREALSAEIHAKALAIGVGRASVEEIDAINILQATHLAMLRALDALPTQPDACLIDGNKCPKGITIPAQTIVKGDSKIAAISAASIVAKVIRDQEMVALHGRHPEYGFDQHKGYGTAKHLDALKTHGPIAEHRRSFAPVAALLKP